MSQEIILEAWRNDKWKPIEGDVLTDKNAPTGPSLKEILITTLVILLLAGGVGIAGYFTVVKEYQEFRTEMARFDDRPAPRDILLNLEGLYIVKFAEEDWFSAEIEKYELDTYILKVYSRYGNNSHTLTIGEGSTLRSETLGTVQVTYMEGLRKVKLEFTINGKKCILERN